MPTDQPSAWVLAQRRAVGRRIRELREQQGIAQDALAHRIGLGKDTVFRAENALNAPTLDTLLLIAHALRVPPNELFATIPLPPESTGPESAE